MLNDKFPVVYDIESFPNIFTFAAIDKTTGEIFYFEISWRVNHMAALKNYLDFCSKNNYVFIGYNNIAYDYSIVHEIMLNPDLYHTAADIYKVNERLINTDWNDRFKNIIPPWKWYIDQIDLLKVHHFDNAAKATSLKKLEFVMRSKKLQDLPYPPGVPVPETDEAAETIRVYNIHDINQTDEFAKHSYKALIFRLSMTDKYDKDFINHNDTKIGKDYFLMRLKENGVHPFKADRSPVQTIRDEIKLADIIFPYVRFKSHDFDSLLNEIKTRVITKSKGKLELKGALSVSAVHKDFQYDFGLGGIHGSVKNQTFHSDDEYVITDADVASYYPNIAIKNKLYPLHLGESFCSVYQDVYEQRKAYPKGTVENKAMKLALNGVYGDSNNVYSPFFDPQYTLTTTVNGQLLLCMLAEQLENIPGLQMIQINTDGLTVRYPRRHKQYYDSICDWWQKLTQLELEFVDYQSMFIRDVNNYIAVTTKGDKKFKGAYVHKGAHLDEDSELEWHKDHSALIVKIAACKALLDGIPVRETITKHTDIFDFFLLAKVGRKDELQLQHNITWDGITVFENQVHEVLQKTSRYLITNTGHKLVKLMPPIKRRGDNVEMYLPTWQSKKITGRNKNLTVTSLHEYTRAFNAGYRTKDKGTYEMTPVRNIGIDKDYLVTIYNNVESAQAHDYDIDYNYYITEAEKLVDGVKGGI